MKWVKGAYTVSSTGSGERCTTKEGVVKMDFDLWTRVLMVSDCRSHITASSIKSLQEDAHIRYIYNLQSCVSVSKWICGTSLSKSIAGVLRIVLELGTSDSAIACGYHCVWLFWRNSQWIIEIYFWGQKNEGQQDSERLFRYEARCDQCKAPTD